MLGNVGVMLQARVTFPLQLLPAHSSVLLCSPSLLACSRSGGGKGEVTVEQWLSSTSPGTPIWCIDHPFTGGTKLTCSNGTGEQNGMGEEVICRGKRHFP